MAGTWEQCVREVTLSADPETVGSVSVGWNSLSTGLGYLRDALVGRSFVGPIASGQERPHTGGLPTLLAGWKGSGGDAYRDHLAEIGKDIEQLITHAANVSGALSRIEGDIRKSVASIPIPLMDNFGWNEWSLPNGTELDDARDGESSSGFLAALRKDYQSNPASYADGAFRDKADDLEATMKIDGNAEDHKRGGWWDTKSHLDNWYNDNQKAATGAMSPLPTAVETERPRLVVPRPDGGDVADGYTPDKQTPPSVNIPGGGGGGGGGGGFGGGGPSVGSIGGGGGGGSFGGGGGVGSIGSPSTGGGHSGGVGSIGSPSTGAPGTGGHEYGTGLAGAAAPTVGTGYGTGTGLGGGLGSAGLGGAGGLGGGVGGGVGSAGGIGGGAAGGIGVGGIPGMVGGGNGKVPPMTSAASALRNAAGAGAGAGGAGALRGGAGMMGGGMMGGHGGAGHGGGGSEHSSWLTEDDDPWGSGDAASPGILR